MKLEVGKFMNLVRAADDKGQSYLRQAQEFKRIAMRADKTDRSFASMIPLAAAVINSR